MNLSDLILYFDFIEPEIDSFTRVESIQLCPSPRKSYFLSERTAEIIMTFKEIISISNSLLVCQNA